MGLKFVPNQPTDCTRLKLEALEFFFRKVRLKVFFFGKDFDNTKEVSGLANKSRFILPTHAMGKDILAFEQAVLSGITELEQKKKFMKKKHD